MTLLKDAELNLSVTEKVLNKSPVKAKKSKGEAYYGDLC
jgi:hypothetical protein